MWRCRRLGGVIKYMTLVNNKIELKERRRSLRNNQTNAELILWNFLKGKQLTGLKFRRQFSFGFYIVDFYCIKNKIAIELDGDSHFTESAKAYDVQRTLYLTGLGVKILRFTNQEIYNNLENVLESINKSCETPPNLPL
jgi:very-short-patch-repair endonuclease